MGDKEVQITAVYKKSATILNTTDIGRILYSPLSTIIVGNLNTKYAIWNSLKNNSTGNTLERYIKTRIYATIAALHTPTHYSDNDNHSPDVLDIAIMNTGSL